ncbi:MAG: TIGR01212 family radical SAM protein [Staphylococcus sp.]|jgi:radical SAM protein, TIGR01212 family|nr:TIGR01212 family radical SAM protein [Staphylococcus sp.]
MNTLINDEKHYVTLNNYLKSLYHKKVFKIALNGNFSCPNRDGTLSNTGCIFCSSKGSGDFAGEKDLTIKEQFLSIVNKMKQKWPNGYYIAYFQANTNTYDSIENLKKRYDQVFDGKNLLDEDIKILSIATRPDCINEEIVKYLAQINQTIPVWIELGFQTMHQHTAIIINRGYLNDTFERAIKLLKKYQLTTIVHIINGLPGETKNDMIETVKYLNKLKINGIKIHMLHIMKETPLENYYQTYPFHILTLEEYVDIVVTQLRYLNDKIVIHRITGDAPKDLLIQPLWTLKKFVVINEIDKLMRKEKIFQGDLCLR